MQRSERSVLQSVLRSERSASEGGQHALEGDTGTKLHVGDVLWRLNIASVGARRPGATLTELRHAGNLDARAQAVSDCNGSDAILTSLIKVVCYVSEHRGGVTMVGIVEGMTCVPVARRDVLQVTQSGAPQHPLPHRLPLPHELIRLQFGNTLTCSQHPCDRRSWVHWIHDTGGGRH